MTPLYVSPSEAVVLRHALMSYRNHIAERRLDPPMADGFELVAADTLVARLDAISEGLLTDDRKRSEAGTEPAPQTTADAVGVLDEAVK